MIAVKRKTGWAKRFVALRKRLGLTQAAAADKLGVSFSTWRAWENNQNTPGRFAKRALKEVFGDISS